MAHLPIKSQGIFALANPLGADFRPLETHLHAQRESRLLDYVSLPLMAAAADDAAIRHRQERKMARLKERQALLDSLRVETNLTFHEETTDD